MQNPWELKPGDRVTWKSPGKAKSIGTVVLVYGRPRYGVEVRRDGERRKRVISGYNVERLKENRDGSDG